MKYALESLTLLVNEIIDPLNTAVEHQQNAFDQLKKKSKRLEKTMLQDLLSQDNETLLASYFTVHMQKLVVLCDLLYEHDLKQQFPLETAVPVLELLASLKEAMPGLVNREIPLPKIFRARQCPVFIRQWDELVLNWKHFKIDEMLLRIAGLPLDEFCYSSRKLSWFHFIWLKKYFAVLSVIDFQNFAPYNRPAYLILDVLIRMNFNHIRFTGYCTRSIKWKTDTYKLREKQLYVLNMLRKVVDQLPLISLEPFFDDADGVKETLDHWMALEIDFREEFDAEPFKIGGKRVSINKYKHVYNLKGEQLAFWQKLQLDHKIYEEESLDIFCDKIAYNSSTKHREDLSPGSIKSKLYTKEEAAIRPLFIILEKMVEELRPFVS